MRGYFEIVITDDSFRRGYFCRVRGLNHRIVWITPGFYTDERTARNAIELLGFDSTDVKVVDERAGADEGLNDSAGIA